MMRNTASVQVNLDLGAPEPRSTSRWRRAHDLGPVLAAAFANSPFDVRGRTDRLAVDPPRGLAARSTRAAPLGVRAPAPTRGRRGPTYALDAPVMMIRVERRRHVPVARRRSRSRAWIDDGHELGWPTIDDFEYHLTTLFPPVRPRGWLELRMIDALPDGGGRSRSR